MSFVRLTDRSASIVFATVAAALALAFALAAAMFRNMEAREDTPAARFGAGAFASAAIGALSLAFVFALEGATLTVALALAGLGAACVSAQLRITALRWCVAGLGVAVAARLALEPRLLTNAGPLPILNWLLYAYGIPALAFGAAAWIMRRAAGEDTPVRVAQALAILFSAFLVFFEIRHFINDGDAFARRTNLVEQGLFAVSALTFAIVLTRLDAGRASIVFRWASLIAGALALGRHRRGPRLRQQSAVLAHRRRGRALRQRAAHRLRAAGDPRARPCARQRERAALLVHAGGEGRGDRARRSAT